MLGAALGELSRAGRDKLTLVLGREMESFGSWVEQLVAEHTGKEGRGLVPVAGSPSVRRTSTATIGCSWRCRSMPCPSTRAPSTSSSTRPSGCSGGARPDLRA